MSHSDPCNTRPSFGATKWLPSDILTEDTGWTRERIVAEDNPLGGTTVVTLFGFKSRRRTWRGFCGVNTRDRLDAQYQANAVATLTDESGETAQALMMELSFKRLRMLGPKRLWEYQIEWVARN